jgi:hypothetical protein
MLCAKALAVARPLSICAAAVLAACAANFLPVPKFSKGSPLSGRTLPLTALAAFFAAFLPFALSADYTPMASGIMSRTSALGAILGFTSGIAGSFTTRTADRMPRHVALLCGQASAPWAPTREMAVEMAAGGTTYGVMGTQETHETDAVFSFIPDEPGITSDALTPWAPAKANLSTVGSHTGVWSVRDMLRLAIGQTWTFAHDYQTVRSSSSERFDYVTVHHDTIRAPRITRSIPDVIRYTTWTAKLVRVTPYTGVRA